MEEIAELKKELLELKTPARTLGDSATAYRIIEDLGDRPTSDNVLYLWDIYVEPLKNPDNAIFSAEPVGGYALDKYSHYPFTKPVFPIVDINDSWHFSLPIWYSNPDYFDIYGSNSISITSNVPFRIKSSSRRTIQIY